MANISFYKKYLNLSSIDQICQVLSSTLIETNLTYDFLVDWNKVTKNKDSFKHELALLSSLKNSKNPHSDLRDLFNKYPEVIKVIPVLLACRDGIISVLDSIDTIFKYKTFTFSKSEFTENEISEIVSFTEKTGLLSILCGMNSAIDYLLGVEVGLDSNARKNRSGLFLENSVNESITNLCKSNRDITFITQKKFQYVKDELGIEVPPSLLDRKFDFTIIYRGKGTTIEVNYYGGTGSKPSEIVSSYSNRQQVLSEAGWKFVWLTDGIGWRKMQNPLHIGVENIDFVINSYMLRQGILEKIILY
jgi:type II restriction enzyme